jgi:hypothetical protein
MANALTRWRLYVAAVAVRYVTRCAPHQLLDDEHALKRLIFYRRRHVALHRGEWLTEPNWTADF